MMFVPRLTRVMEGGELVSIVLGHPLLDAYLEFVAVRGATNTWLATAYDLKVFFEVVGKDPAEVKSADVFAFFAEQRRPRRGEKVVRIEDGEAGLAARTIARRLSSVAGLFEYLLARGDAGVASKSGPARVGVAAAGAAWPRWSATASLRGARPAAAGRECRRAAGARRVAEGGRVRRRRRLRVLLATWPATRWLRAC